jgi:hypothetical protein
MADITTVPTGTTGMRNLDLLSYTVRIIVEQTEPIEIMNLKKGQEQDAKGLTLSAATRKAVH